ncbi:four helix bundle protein [Candidatus Azambacteria bacterium]|nr:four helix bundle protein [Candidatus Azambacteria bacterium]
MTNQIKNPKSQKQYNLGERTAVFGENIIEFAIALPETNVNKPLINQIVRSGSSVGANYMEADGAESKKDFRHKISLSKKESKETMYWLRMIARANPTKKDICRKLWQEAHELALIFAAITQQKN